MNFCAEQNDVDNLTQTIEFLFALFWPDISKRNVFPSKLTKPGVQEYLGISETERQLQIEIAKVLGFDYVDDNGILDLFCAYIDNANLKSSYFSKTSKIVSYYSPLVALCQRSGKLALYWKWVEDTSHWYIYPSAAR